MGTRSLTHVKDESGNTVVTMYRQMDGYPSGHGVALANFLSGKKVVNGIALGGVTDNQFNGMSCLAASLVAHFKTGIGGFYLLAPDSKDSGEEYTYTVYGGVKGNIGIKVCDGDAVVFNGAVSEFQDWLDSESS